MPPTLRGVYHNLKESKYTVSNGETVFFFSSELYLNKFLNGYEDNRRKFYERNKKLLNTENLNFDYLIDVNFYKTIEKRGYYVQIRRIDFTCHEVEKFALRKMMLKNLNVWQRT